MIKDLLFIMIFSFISFSTFAQKKKIKFHSINSFGLIAGESNFSTAIQTVNGIRFSNWFAGAGIGIDHYAYKTLPLFFDVRKYFGVEKNAFIYGDIGYGFPMKNKRGKESFRNDVYHFTGGIYTDFGLGYSIPLLKKTALAFSLGYSYKKLQGEFGSRICPNNSPCYINYTQSTFKYSRIMLKAGVVF